jgi:hypothetical protein
MGVSAKITAQKRFYNVGNRPELNETYCGLIPIQWHGLDYAISCLFTGNIISKVKGTRANRIKLNCL